MPRRLVVLIAALSVLLAMPSAALAGTLDQAQESGPTGQHISSVFEFAQVFTAGLTGQLDQVDLLVTRRGDPADALTVEIWTVSGGAPAASIATAAVLQADVPMDSPTWVSIPFNVPSLAGTQYAIVGSSPGSTCGEEFENCWRWHADDSGPYAGGGSWLSTNGGATFIAQGRDHAFRTFVAAPPAPSVAASLADAAMAPPTPASPLATLGFAALLLGSLGVLAFANVRRR